MLQYESLPVQIKAEQWDGSAESATPIIDFALQNGGNIKFFAKGEADYDLHSAYLLIETLEGPFWCPPDWWIIQGTEGEFYACKDSVFQRKYKRLVIG